MARSRSSSSWWSRRRPLTVPARPTERLASMKASLMITCLADMFFPEVGVAVVSLLRRPGVTVEFPEGQTCCGMPLFNSGYHADAAAVAARTVDLFAGAEHV